MLDNPRMISRELLSLCVLILSTRQLFTQTASIEGIVKDQTEGAVVGAQVVVTNLDTGLRREAIAGLYALPTLPVGRYTLKATTSRDELTLESLFQSDSH
jgi:hypothetical protein